MAIILSLETSSGVCSVALHEDEKLLSLAEIHQDQAHASKLAKLIEHAMQAVGLPMSKLSAVAVSSGPGSYTGLRIGTSTAKGMCYALSIPLIAVSTLEVMTSQVSKMNVSGYLLCPMIDARRMEVYCALFDQRGNVVSPIEAKVIDESSFDEYLESGRILFFGNGSAKCASVLTHENALFIDGVYPSASQLGNIAVIKFRAGEFADVTQFEPFYLKEFKAKMPANIISKG